MGLSLSLKPKTHTHKPIKTHNRNPNFFSSHVCIILKNTQFSSEFSILKFFIFYNICHTVFNLINYRRLIINFIQSFFNLFKSCDLFATLLKMNKEDNFDLNSEENWLKLWKNLIESSLNQTE